MNTLSDEYVKELLLNKRSYKAEHELLLAMKRRGKQLTKKQTARLLWLEAYNEHTEMWLASLQEDERYVLQRHLIDGVDWPRIATEYNSKWGNENAKAHRTLMMYQKKALQQIVTTFGAFQADFPVSQIPR